ncbi:hypothetical protein [Lactobacillus crustorum] [Lactiplantibacillus mudanjiangensis]|uniref:hypothetical protein n=1 Tax=Lactiplantibacillus mudanjiangensis TaxID=1296538 RepID=UPI001015089C|nr:hypothetical protein [Lactobacillus crustorum] [Lactiplantibacillus mudanjiangensis]
MLKLPFNELDSWALWNTPADDEIRGKDAKAVEALFGEAYQENHFPSEQLPSDLKEALASTKYVLVGLNPGNAAVERESDVPFLYFHGAKKSMDYRMAAAVYGTEVWGALMTDLDGTIESDSRKIKVGQLQVAALEHHLDELGVSKDAKLIAMGKAAYETLSKYSQHPVFKVAHYSGTNSGAGQGRWQADSAKAAVLVAVAG